jgi:hypothetical protein
VAFLVFHFEKEYSINAAIQKWDSVHRLGQCSVLHVLIRTEIFWDRSPSAVWTMEPPQFPPQRTKKQSQYSTII